MFDVAENAYSMIERRDKAIQIKHRLKRNISYLFDSELMSIFHVMNMHEIDRRRSSLMNFDILALLFLAHL